MAARLTGKEFPRTRRAARPQINRRHVESPLTPRQAGFRRPTSRFSGGDCVGEEERRHTISTANRLLSLVRGSITAPARGLRGARPATPVRTAGWALVVSALRRNRRISVASAFQAESSHFCSFRLQAESSHFCSFRLQAECARVSPVVSAFRRNRRTSVVSAFRRNRRNLQFPLSGGTALISGSFRLQAESSKGEREDVERMFSRRRSR